MTEEQILLIQNFRDSIKSLKSSGVIRSHRYLGDLGEFLCADAFGINLSDNLRERGHDGMLGNSRVQIKYHGGSSTTANLGQPCQYDEVFIVLGPDSVLRPSNYCQDFLIYQLTSEAVTSFRSESGMYHCTSGRLPENPSHCISLGDIA